MQSFFQKIKKYWFQLGVFLLLFLAVLLRFPFLDTYPPLMLQDEAGIGYAAISIAETGNDEWGNKYPLIFRSFGDYKSPAFIYTTALLYKVIGFTPVLPRITSALAGILFVFSITMLTKSLTKSKKLALVAGLLATTSPWTVHLSRLGVESNFGLSLFTTGLWLYFKNPKSKICLLFSALFLSLSTYAFHSYRYSIGLLIVALISGKYLLQVIEHKIIVPKFTPKIKSLTILLLLTSVLSAPGFFTKGVTGRLNQTLLFTKDEVISIYKHHENNCHNTAIYQNTSLTIICRLKYNPISRSILIGTDSLVKHLNPSFLFFTGDTDAGRNPTQTGLFFVFLFPLWMLGIIEVLKKYKKHDFIIIGYLVSMLPSIVSGDPHSFRLSIMIPFVILTIVIGYSQFEKIVTKRVALLTFLLLTLVFTPLFAIRYAVDTFSTNEQNATFLSYAPKAAILMHNYVLDGYTVYVGDDIYPEPHIFYAFFNNISPKHTQKSFLDVYTEEDGFTRPKQFGTNIFFEQGNISSIDCNSEKKVVFFTKLKKENYQPSKIIKDNNKLHAFVYVYDSKDICKQK